MHEPITRVLQVHVRYRQPGGEEAVVEAERSLLSAAGLHVRQLIFENADLHESESLAGDIRLVAGAIWSRPAARRVRRALEQSGAQVMHVHNTFAAASPSVHVAAAGLGVPVVQTLHNYRMVCPVAITFRDGHACTDCVGRVIPWPALVHACVRDSRPQSAVAAATMAFHRIRGTFTHDVSIYIALTRFQRELMVAGGLPGDRITVVPNFLEPDPGAGAAGTRAGVCFVGRLSIEKGIDTLVTAARIMAIGNLTVAGSGPLSNMVERAAGQGLLAYPGPLPRDAVADALQRASALVIPSRWFEGLPLVLIEAFAAGTPVIASRIGSLAELVDDGITGILVDPGDERALGHAMRWAIEHPTEMVRMGENARRRYEANYRGPGHLAALLDTYRWAAIRIAHKRAV